MRVISLLFLAVLIYPSAARANVNEIFAELLGRPDRGGIKGSYEIQQYETKDLKFGKGKLGLRQHSVQASVPLNKLSDRKWKLLLNADGEEIRSDARFPDGRPMPNKLWNLGAGLSYSRMLEGDRVIGGSFLVGSTSDQPFGALRDFSFQGNLVYKIPTENEAAWIFIANISSDRGFLNYLPLPGVAYFFKARENLRMAVGIPFFMLFWSPIEKSVLSLTYLPLTNTQAKFSYFIFGPAHAFLQAKYHTKNFRLSDRSNDDERIFYGEAVGSVGFAMPLERNWMMEGALSYSFDRKYFLGEDEVDRRDGRVLLPGKTPMATIKLVSSF